MSSRPELTRDLRYWLPVTESQGLSVYRRTVFPIWLCNCKTLLSERIYYLAIYLNIAIYAGNFMLPINLVSDLEIAIAAGSHKTGAMLHRVIMGTWSSPVAIIFKAISFRLATVDAIYRSRLPSGDVIRNDGIQTKAEFIAVSRPTAERIMRFFRVRKSVEHF